MDKDSSIPRCQLRSGVLTPNVCGLEGMVAGWIIDEEGVRMGWSSYRPVAASSPGNRRMLAVGAVIAAVGAVIAFTTTSNAATIQASQQVKMNSPFTLKVGTAIPTRA